MKIVRVDRIISPSFETASSLEFGTCGFEMWFPRRKVFEYI